VAKLPVPPLLNALLPVPLLKLLLPGLLRPLLPDAPPKGWLLKPVGWLPSPLDGVEFRPGLLKLLLGGVKPGLVLVAELNGALPVPEVKLLVPVPDLIPPAAPGVLPAKG
jgi:hypothetical protein